MMMVLGLAVSADIHTAPSVLEMTTRAMELID